MVPPANPRERQLEPRVAYRPVRDRHDRAGDDDQRRPFGDDDIDRSGLRVLNLRAGLVPVRPGRWTVRRLWVACPLRLARSWNARLQCPGSRHSRECGRNAGRASVDYRRAAAATCTAATSTSDPAPASASTDEQQGDPLRRAAAHGPDATTLTHAAHACRLSPRTRAPGLLACTQAADLCAVAEGRPTARAGHAGECLDQPWAAAVAALSASEAGTAPSRTTTGSGPVKSSTVDGVPGSSPASSTAEQPARSSSGTSSTLHGSGPPGRLALVAARAPTRRRTAAAVSGGIGTRTPIVVGRLPVSHRKRRAGFGRISVYGPGRSARAITPARPRSSGTASSRTSTSAATSAVGCTSSRPLSR